MSTMKRDRKSARRRARLARRGQRGRSTEEISDKMLELLLLSRSPDAVEQPRGRPAAYIRLADQAG